MLRRKRAQFAITDEELFWDVDPATAPVLAEEDDGGAPDHAAAPVAAVERDDVPDAEPDARVESDSGRPRRRLTLRGARLAALVALAAAGFALALTVGWSSHDDAAPKRAQATAPQSPDDRSAVVTSAPEERAEADTPPRRRTERSAQRRKSSTNSRERPKPRRRTTPSSSREATAPASPAPASTPAPAPAAPAPQPAAPAPPSDEFGLEG